MVKKSVPIEEPKNPSDNVKITAILKAAQKRFGHFGLAKTTMNEIAVDVGISKASLYYYFPDKERLFLAVINKEQEAFEKAAEEMIDKTGKAAGKLKQFVTLRLEFFRQLLNLGKFTHQSVTELSKPFAEELRVRHFNIEKEIAKKLFRTGISAGEFIRFDVEAYTDLFVTGLAGFRALTMKNTNYNLTTEDYANMDRQMKLFTEVIIKAITKQ